jgi:glycosyltransferase involved in cell wall biosynthesis
MKKNKTISVIVTCHNLEEYLGQTIQSIQDQFKPADEVILIHDGCEKPMAFNGVNTVFLSNNLGVSNARDVGVKMSKGDFILFVDGDDVLPDNFLKEVYNTIMKEDCDIVYPDSYLWSSWNYSGMPNEYWKAPDSIRKSEMKDFNKVIVTSLMKREVYDKYGPFDSSLKIFEDWDFFMKALCDGASFCKARTYLKYRQRTQSRNHKHTQKERQEVFNHIRARYEK